MLLVKEMYSHYGIDKGKRELKDKLEMANRNHDFNKSNINIHNNHNNYIKLFTLNIEQDKHNKLFHLDVYDDNDPDLKIFKIDPKLSKNKDNNILNNELKIIHTENSLCDQVNN